MELKEQQKKSRKILEWAGWIAHHNRLPSTCMSMESYCDEDWWETPDGKCFDTDGLELNLYSKENLWILFEYVIPKFAGVEIWSSMVGWSLNFYREVGKDRIHEDAESLSEALCSAILKAMEADNGHTG